MSKNVRNLLIVLGIILGVSFSFPAFYNKMLHNLMRVEFLKTLMADDIAATQRRADLNRILAMAEWMPNYRSQVEAPLQACGMLPALLHAQYYFRLGDWEKTLGWIAIAKNSLPFPAQQQSILVPVTAALLADEQIVIPYSESSWRLRHNNHSVDLEILSPGEARIVFPNQADTRDILIYSWREGINAVYQPSLHLEVWLREGTYLTVETVTNLQTRERHINYYPGEGKWSSFDLPLDAASLDVIDLSLGEPGISGASASMPSVPFYEAIFRAPALPLSEALGTCDAVAQADEP